MLRRWIVTAGIIVWSGCSWGAALASAQDLASPLSSVMPKLSFAAGTVARAAADAAATDAAAPSAPVLTLNTSRIDKTMMPLYASAAALQFMDLHSTMQVIHLGGAEGNPLMKGIVAHPAMFVALKAAVGASIIYSANRLAKKNKGAAIATMIAMNSVYAMVVSHNYRLAQSMR
jgi:hypothetical protein